LKVLKKILSLFKKEEKVDEKKRSNFP